jgi:hypothetical protein
LVFAILQQLRVKASGLFRRKSQFRSAPRTVQSVQAVGVRLQRFFVLDQRFPWPAQLQQHVSQHLPGRQLDFAFSEGVLFVGNRPEKTQGFLVLPFCEG